MQIKRSLIPVATRGATGTVSVSVRENGQIAFSSKAGDAFDKATHCMIDWEPKTRSLSFTPADPTKLPKGWAAEDLIEVKEGKDESRYMGLAGLFRLPDINYDYKKFGTHTYPATINDKTSAVSFVLPAEIAVAVKKPRAPRAAKVNGATNGAAATSGATSAPATNGADAGKSNVASAPATGDVNLEAA